jgi:hypothetical protein
VEVSLPFTCVKFALRFLADDKRRKFILACQNPEKAQEELKQEILKHSKIPVPKGPQTYLDYENRADDLTDLPITFFETTSGSTGKKKQIPYNKKILARFENMFLLWGHDLIFHSGLKLTSGKFFMSISPQIGIGKQNGHDDREYLSKGLNLLLSPFLVSPPKNHHAKYGEDFLLSLAKDLLKASKLEIISIWSPTYFLSLLSFMEKNRVSLNLPEGKIDWVKVWPHLKLISCWRDAGAKGSARHLKEKFPKVILQGKGLLLTEAPVTIPWSEAKGEVPLLT